MRWELLWCVDACIWARCVPPAYEIVVSNHRDTCTMDRDSMQTRAWGYYHSLGISNSAPLFFYRSTTVATIVASFATNKHYCWVSIWKVTIGNCGQKLLLAAYRAEECQKPSVSHFRSVTFHLPRSFVTLWRKMSCLFKDLFVHGTEHSQSLR